MKPYYEHGGATLFNGDVLQWCEEYEGEKFHAMLCDPPYHLISTSSRNGSARTEGTTDGSMPFNRHGISIKGKGFMGKDWDGGDIAFRPETWAALGEHLHPGAFCFAFASTRGVHRMACAIEDAGFILHPTIFLYCFGSGFPKATRIDTQIDRAAGVAVEQGKAFNAAGAGERGDIKANACGDGTRLHEPATDLAKAWQGHRYGGQSLKPAVEPVICFQVPYAKGRKPVDCITETGAGALNIDGARLSSDERSSGGIAKVQSMFQAGGQGERPDGGRWPANFCVDEFAAVRLDLQSGVLTSGNVKPYTSKSDGFLQGCNGKRISDFNGDTGGASRFFLNYDWNYEVEERLAESEPVLYTSKASRRERNEGCEENANNHPTVKPHKLTTWLATLLLPPDIYAPRRVLVPFAGSGSEMLGGLHAGFEEVVGIEGAAEYCEINRARVAYGLGRIKSGQPATAQGQLFTAEPEPQPQPQPLTLFEVAA